MKKHLLTAIVSASLGLSTAAIYAQGQSPAGLVKPKSPPKTSEVVEEKVMPVRASVSTASHSPIADKAGMADSKAPRLVFNPRHEQKLAK